MNELMDRRKNLEDRLDELHDNIMIYIQEFASEEELTEEGRKASGRLSGTEEVKLQMSNTSLIHSWRSIAFR